MLKRIIDVTLAYRWFVVLGLFVLLAVGGYALYTLPVEAFPDLTNNQVTVVTEAPSMPPTEVEQLVTYPIEQAMMGMPKQQEVRSLSELGLSIVTIVFDDSVPMYFARQLVNERLQQITSQLPSGIQPVLGLPATAFGELYQYTLSGPMSPMALKDLQEWQIKRQLRMVPGVSEVNTWGGEVKQYQITVDPAVLAQYGLTLNDVAQRVEENNQNFGGGFIEHNDEQYTMRGAGRAESTDDLGNIVLLSRNGTPVLLRDVATVAIGAAPRHGAVLRNGETVSGMVIMLKGENGKRVIQAIKQRIAGMRLTSRREDQSLLRPVLGDRWNDSDGQEESLRRLPSGDGRPLSLSRQCPCGADYCIGDTPRYAGELLQHARLRGQCQPDEPGRHRLRHDRRWRRGHDGECHSSSRREACGRTSPRNDSLRGV